MTWPSKERDKRDLSKDTWHQNIPIHNTACHRSGNTRDAVQLREGCGRMHNVGSSHGILERVVTVERLWYIKTTSFFKIFHGTIQQKGVERAMDGQLHSINATTE